MNKVRAGIVGSGNIGTDLMYKLTKSDFIELQYMIGIDPESEGIRRAKELGIEASHQGIEWLFSQKIKPECPEILHQKGLALQMQGKLEEAIITLKEILSHHPEDVNAHNNIGAALKDQGKFSEAMAAFNRTLALKPNHAKAHRNLSQLKSYSASDPQIRDMKEMYAKDQVVGYILHHHVLTQSN